ncbi:MAG: PIN domain-containing protein, partial [Prolixibacteraceae bacterium]|nr:PIN domain-containing protein [Prolixibacteraceae bacterium]
MTKVLFDTNIILDIALKRESFFEDAFKLFSLIDQKKIIGIITASTITDIYYISKKEKGHTESINFIKGLIEVVEVIGIDKDIIIKALTSGIQDFEDAIQTCAAELNEIEVIITRNKKDFTNTSLKIL